MYLTTIEQLNPDRVGRFYTPDHSGVFIIHDPLLAREVLRGFEPVNRFPFAPKSHPEINLGQESCELESEILLRIYQMIREKFPMNHTATRISSGFTRYPAGPRGSAFHQDFSRNQICTITFFSGHAIFHCADDRTGTNLREFVIRPGDILVMRGPRDSSDLEKRLRSVHAIDLVPAELYTYEVREVVK